MSALRWILLIVTAVALAANAVIHLQLAPAYDALTGTLISQGMLFRIQAVVGAIVIVALFVLRRGRPGLAAAIAAALVAAGGLALVVITALVPLDLTAIGLPYLFEPLWFPQKTATAVAQGIAVVTALALLPLTPHSAREVSADVPRPAPL